jgi:aspartate kinase
MADIRPLVMKFGGTSVRSAEQRLAAARRVCEAQTAGYHPVVVVSAIGRRGEPYATDTLISLAEEIDPDIAPREKDLLMACGEIISTVIMAHLIRKIGDCPTVALTGGQAGIATDRRFGAARIMAIDATRIQRCFDEGAIPVVAGFQGVTQGSAAHEHGSITTLGRGGSDTSGSALGAAVRAVEVQIFTDVPGIMTADPRIVPDARTLRTITYQEICEMAHQGASVLHPRAAEIAMEYDIPLRVLSTMEEGDGTLVVRDADIDRSREHGVTGVAHSNAVVPLTIRVEDEYCKPQIERDALASVAAKDISIYFTSDTPETMNFVVDRDLLPAALDAVENTIVKATDQDGQTRRFRVARHPNVDADDDATPVELEVHADCVIVSVIGRDLRRVPGVMARAAEALEDAGIEIIQVAGSSNALSCLIREPHTEEAVRRLHEKFHLHFKDEAAGGG